MIAMTTSKLDEGEGGRRTPYSSGVHGADITPRKRVCTMLSFKGLRLFLCHVERSETSLIIGSAADERSKII